MSGVRTMPELVQGHARPTILVVEDEAPLITLLRYNLEKQGFRVEEAADGQEALLRVAEARPLAFQRCAPKSVC